MKTTYILILGILAFLCIVSCKKEDTFKGNGFQIIFSDGSAIAENDIQFYDTSVHILFLKQNFILKKGNFEVRVGDELIYQGVVYPGYLSSMPTKPIFTFESLGGIDVINIGCWKESFDFRNDLRIINALKKSNLLHYGLECRIDDIQISAISDYSSVTCEITVKNNDNFSYYIIDPTKMGELDFNYYTGGLFFTNLSTASNSFLQWTNSNPDYYNISINDLSILQAGQEVTYNFSSSDYSKMEKGVYKAVFRFQGFNDTENTDLDQRNGRIWIGSLNSVKNDIIVN
jgi:hypothetical protein